WLANTPVTWDVSTGIVFTYALDASHADVPGVNATGASVFWYDDAVDGQRLSVLAPTGPAGLVAVVNATGPTVAFDLVPPTDSRMLQTTHVEADAVPAYLTVKVVTLKHP